MIFRDLAQVVKQNFFQNVNATDKSIQLESQTTKFFKKSELEMEKIMQMPLSTLENLKIFEILDGDVDPEVRMDVIMKLQDICSQVAISCKNLSLDPMSMSKRFHLHQVF